MSKQKLNKPTWMVAKFELVRQLKKPAFWAAVLLMPIIIGVAILIGIVAENDSAVTMPTLEEGTVVAITDEAGVLPADNPFAKICESKEECINKVVSGEVDLYYYIPADFLEKKAAEFYHISEGLEMFNYDANILKSILSQYAAEKVNPVDAMVLSQGYEVTDFKLSADGEETNALGELVVPLIFLVTFFMFVALLGNRFLMAVVEEKENRISEMILTAVSAKHLVVGKIIAMLVLGVIQIVVMAVPVVILVMMNKDNAMVSTVLASVELDPVTIAMNLALFVVSVFFYAGVCVFVGSLTATARDASSFIGPAIVAMVFPLYFVPAFLASEPGVMVYFLSYFPLSAPIALMLRSGVGTLSTWEFILGVIEMTVFAVIMTRLAVITFQKNAINFRRVRLRLARRK